MRIPRGKAAFARPVILILTVVAFNLIGDAVRDALDVRLQRP